MGRKRTVKAVVFTLIITILVIGVLAFFAIQKIASDKDATISDLRNQISKTKAYVFSKDLKAGSVITPADITLTEITNTSKTTGMFLNSQPNPNYGVIPDQPEVLDAGAWMDSEGVPHQYAFYYLKGKDDSENYLKVLLDEEVYGRSVRANVSKNTAVLDALLYAREGADDKDVRLEELADSYMTFPTDLQEADYIDVRLQFPTGEDYTVLVGKKIEALGKDADGKPISSSAYIKMSEAERMLFESAIVEAYMQKGMRIYSTKYTDPAAQLYKESIVDYVDRFEAGIKAALDAKNGEAQQEPATQPETNASGEVVNSPYVPATQMYTERDLTIEEIASYAGMSVDNAKSIREAKDRNDSATLEFYRHFKVQTRTPIEVTYPVKAEVLALVKNNQNLIQTIKDEFDLREQLRTRIDKYKELEAQLAVAPTEKYGYSNEKIKSEIMQEMEELLNGRADNIEKAMEEEVEAQKARRVEYLQALLAGK